MFTSLGKDIWSRAYATRFWGVHFPCASFALRLEKKLLILSPGPWDEALAPALHDLGEVAFLVAPNAFHHLHLAAWKTRFPQAELWGPSRLGKKRPELNFDHYFTEQSQPFAPALTLHPLWGAPGVSETAFFHQASQSLILTDLLFNLNEIQGRWSHCFFFLLGIHGRLGSSRLFQSAVNDKKKFAQASKDLLSLDFTQVLLHHGENLERDAKTQLEAALAWAKK